MTETADDKTSETKQLLVRLTSQPASSQTRMTVPHHVSAVSELYKVAESLFSLPEGAVVGLFLDSLSDVVHKSSSNWKEVTTSEEVSALPHCTPVVFRLGRASRPNLVSQVTPHCTVREEEQNPRAPALVMPVALDIQNTSAVLSPQQWTAVPLDSWKAVNNGQAPTCSVQAAGAGDCSAFKRIRRVDNSSPVPDDSGEKCAEGGDHSYMRTKAHNARGTEQNYRCGYCGARRTSASSCTDGRVRIRCPCGGLHKDNRPRMHAKWIKLSEDESQASSPVTAVLSMQLTSPSSLPTNQAAAGATVTIEAIPAKLISDEGPKLAAKSCEAPVIVSSTRVAQHVTDVNEERKGARLETLLGALIEDKKLQVSTIG